MHWDQVFLSIIHHHKQARVQEFARGGAQNSKAFFFAFQFLGGGPRPLGPPLDTRLIKENVLKLEDKYNAAQTVKETRQLHRFQPQGKLLVYNTSLQASPPTEGIIVKSISLSRVQIEYNTLQISSFVACPYDEKWWPGMVAQVSDEFIDHNINFYFLSWKLVPINMAAGCHLC